MISSELDEKHFSGWVVLGGTMLVYGGICGNIWYSYGVFLSSMSETFGWSRAALSGPYTLFIIICGILGPLVGFTLSRFGARKNILLGSIIIVLGLMGMSQVHEIWHLYIFFGFFGGLGVAFSEYLSLTTVINHWFIRRRSLALGFFFASGGVCGFFLPPLITIMITALGWRWAWACLALNHLVLGIILPGLLIRNKPEDVGQVPDGQDLKNSVDQSDNSAKRSAYSTAEDWNLRDAMRTPVLWILFIIFSSCMFAIALLLSHQVAYLEDLNYSPMISATAFGLMMGMSILGRISGGILGMWFEGRYLVTLFMALMGLGIVSLMNATEIIFVYLYSILTGIGYGGMIVLMTNLIGAYFGRMNFSRILGWTMPVVTVASAISPILAGFFYDATGSYSMIFFFVALFLFVCCIMALFLHPPRLAK